MRTWLLISCVGLAAVTLCEYGGLAYMAIVIITPGAHVSVRSPAGLASVAGTLVTIIVSGVSAGCMHWHLVHKTGMDRLMALQWTFIAMLVALPAALVTALLGVILTIAHPDSVWAGVIFCQVLLLSLPLYYWAAVVAIRLRPADPPQRPHPSQPHPANGSAPPPQSSVPPSGKHYVEARFAAGARAVILHGQEAAARLQSCHVEPEHLLLGLVWRHECLAAQLLRQAGLTPERIEADLVASERSNTRNEALDPTLSGDARSVFELAAAEARRLHHPYITPEHLLLGMVRQQRPGCISLLAQSGLTLEALRAQIVLHYRNAESWDPPSELAPPEPRGTSPDLQNLKARVAAMEAQIIDLETQLAEVKRPLPDSS